MATKAALYRVLVILGGCFLSFGAIGCPDGKECTTPNVTVWCYGISGWACPTCMQYPGCPLGAIHGYPYASESDAKASRLEQSFSVNNSCGWTGVVDLSDWMVTGYWPNNKTTPTGWPWSELKEATVAYSSAPSATCDGAAQATLVRTRILNCPSGFAVDYGSGLCVRDRVDCPYCIGDPVLLPSGELIETETDYRGGGPFPLELRRFYRSLPSTASETFPIVWTMGRSWRHNFDREIKVPTASPAVAWAIRPRGNNHYFDASGSNWAGRHDERDNLSQLPGGGWTYVTATDETEFYNASGQLTQVVTRTGLAQSFSYDDGGALIGVSDPFGRQLNFAYAKGQLSSVTDPLGNAYNYSYDSIGNLTKVTWPDGEARNYVYDEAANGVGSTMHGYLTGVIDENGSRLASFWYYSYGVSKSQQAGGVNSWAFSFGFPTDPWTLDPNGLKRTHWFAMIAGAYRPTGVSLPCPQCGAIPASIGYDANGNVNSTWDFNHVQTERTYDLVRNLETARIEGVGGCPVNTTYYPGAYGTSCTTGTCMSPYWFTGAQQITTPPFTNWFYSCASAAVRTTSTQWHAVWRQPTKIAEPNRITTFTYNGDGGVYCAPTTALVNGHPIGVLCKKSVQATTDATGAQAFSAVVTGSARTSTYTYDAYGQVLSARDPNGRITTTAYYSATDPDSGKRGNVATITNPLGHVTTYTAYDLNGRPTSIIDANGAVTTLAYDLRGHLTSRTNAGETTAYAYDGVGQLTRATLPDGSYVAYTYDAAHRLTQLQDGLGNKIVYTLDAIGNRVTEQAFDTAGVLARSQQRVYDASNNLHQVIGAH